MLSYRGLVIGGLISLAMWGLAFGWPLNGCDNYCGGLTSLAPIERGVDHGRRPGARDATRRRRLHRRAAREDLATGARRCPEKSTDCCLGPNWVQVRVAFSNSLG